MEELNPWLDANSGRHKNKKSVKPNTEIISLIGKVISEQKYIPIQPAN